MISTVIWMLAADFYLINTFRFLFVPGSRPRYVLASIAWPICWAPLLSTVLDSLNRIPHWQFWLGLSLIVWPTHIWWLVNDDDDNYWRRTRRRISGWLRAQLYRPLVPVEARF